MTNQLGISMPTFDSSSSLRLDLLFFEVPLAGNALAASSLLFASLALCGRRVRTVALLALVELGARIAAADVAVTGGNSSMVLGVRTLLATRSRAPPLLPGASIVS